MMLYGVSDHLLHCLEMVQHSAATAKLALAASEMSHPVHKSRICVSCRSRPDVHHARPLILTVPRHNLEEFAARDVWTHLKLV